MEMWTPFKKEGKMAGGSAKPPASQRVSTLSGQGYSDPDIIRTMRTEGYSPSEVDSAMKSALRGAAAGAPDKNFYSPIGRPEPVKPEFQPLPGERSPEPRPEPEPRPPAGPPGPEEQYRGPQDLSLPSIPRPGEPFQGGEDEPEEEFLPPVSRRHDDVGVRNDIEEVTEGIIDEKWNMFTRELDEVTKRLESLDKKISNLEVEIAEFKGVKKTDVEAIRGSIDSYKESISEISERMEAIERAVKDSLTPMMHSMRSLSDAVKALKGK
jgi:prefoldin subunit 5